MTQHLWLLLSGKLISFSYDSFSILHSRPLSWYEPKAGSYGGALFVSTFAFDSQIPKSGPGFSSALLPCSMSLSFQNSMIIFNLLQSRSILILFKIFIVSS
jgi:hypothetical protein